MRWAGERGLIGDAPTVAGDSTGFESRHSSRYYLFRCGKRHLRSRWPKLSVVCDCATHLPLAAKAARAPRGEPRDGISMLRSARRRLELGTVLLDAGYDSEAMHELIRWELGAESVIPARASPSSPGPPAGFNRRRMREEFPAEAYGQRWQIESLFSRIKRRLGSELRATSHQGRMAELYAKVLTHALALLALVKTCLFYRALSPRDSPESANGARIRAQKRGS